MKVNAADLLRTLLVKAPDSTGYVVTLDQLSLHSIEVEGQDLVWWTWMRLSKSTDAVSGND